MRVISTPDLAAWKYACTCGTCTSKLEADSNDLLFKIERKYYSGTMDDSGYYANEDVYYVICPLCSKEVGVHPGDIPYLLKEKTKTKVKKS